MYTKHVLRSSKRTRFVFIYAFRAVTYRARTVSLWFSIVESNGGFENAGQLPRNRWNRRHIFDWTVENIRVFPFSRLEIYLRTREKNSPSVPFKTIISPPSVLQFVAFFFFFFWIVTFFARTVLNIIVNRRTVRRNIKEALTIYMYYYYSFTMEKRNRNTNYIYIYKWRRDY